jgi:hypothetical protein
VVVNGILWKLRTGSPWRGLSGRYNPYKRRAEERTRTADLISLRVRFGLLYPSRKVAYLKGKAFAAYRRVTLNYAQVSVPVSVRWLLTGFEPGTFSRAQYDATNRSQFCCVRFFGLFRGFLSDSEEYFCPLRASLHQPGCSTLKTRTSETLSVSWVTITCLSHWRSGNRSRTSTPLRRSGLLGHLDLTPIISLIGHRLE